MKMDRDKILPYELLMDGGFENEIVIIPDLESHFFDYYLKWP